MFTTLERKHPTGNTLDRAAPAVLDRTVEDGRLGNGPRTHRADQLDTADGTAGHRPRGEEIRHRTHDEISSCVHGVETSAAPRGVPAVPSA